MERLNQKELRSCLSRFGTGVTVVTVGVADGLHALTVNAFTSVSLEPALVLVSINQRARGHNLLAGSSFVVNVLGAEQEGIARHFAGHRRPDLHIPWINGMVAPRLLDPLAFFECTPWRTYEGGDHSLYVGEIVNFGHRSGPALGFYAGGFLPLLEPGPDERPFPYDVFELPYDAYEQT